MPQADSLRKRFDSFLSYKTFETTILSLTGLAAALFFIQAMFFFPVTDENFDEVPGVVKTLRWARGEPLYADYRQPPYLLTPFPPLGYAGMVLAARAGFRDVDSLTLFGRLFSFTLLVGVAVLTYLWNRSRGFTRAVSLLTPALFFSFPPLINWAVNARQDMPAIFFSFLAVFLVTRERSIPYVVFGAAASSVAILVKHSSLAVPTAVVLWLLAERRWRPALVFASVCVLLVGGTILGFDIASDGLLRLNLRGAYFGSFSLRNMHELLISLFVTKGQQLSLFLLGLGLFGFLNSWTSQDGKSRLLRYYFMTSYGFALFGSGLANASVNHFLEPILAGALLAAFGMHALRQTWPSSSPLPSLAFALALTFLVPALDTQRWEMLNTRPQDLRGVVAIARNRKVLTDIAFVGARTSEPAFLQPISLKFAEQTGSWSSSGIAADVHAKRYDLVILHWPVDDPRWATHRYSRLGRTIRSAIQQSYGFCGQIGSAYVYAPMKDLALPPANCPPAASHSR